MFDSSINTFFLFKIIVCRTVGNHLTTNFAILFQKGSDIYLFFIF